VRILRWVLAGVLLAVLVGFVGGLLRRHTQSAGTVAYVSPEPATDERVAGQYPVPPPTVG
jgi:hypothetical protein